MIHTRLVVLISVLCLAAIPLQAEMIFQPKKSRLQREWREAGADLFAGIARIFDGLAALEQKETSTARNQFSSAMKSLEKADQGYTRIAHTAASDQRTSIDRLSPEEGKGIRQLFSKYNLRAPEDERAAAEIAAKESKRLRESLGNLVERITKCDVKALQELLAGIARVEVVGTHTALLFDLTAQNEH